LPGILPEICLKGLKGEINSFAESRLAIKLCEFLIYSKDFLTYLISHGLLQSLSDIMLECKSSGVKLRILELVKRLVSTKEGLNAVQKMNLVIVNKPQIIEAEKPKEKKAKHDDKNKPKDKEKDKKDHKHGHSHEKKKHKHEHEHEHEDSKEKSEKDKKKSHKHEKSHHKRSHSKSEHSESEEKPKKEEEIPEKKKKVITSALGEVIESDYNITTFYQLVLSLLMAKQGAIIIKLVKEIIERVEFVGNLIKIAEITKEIQKNPAYFIFSIETVYENLCQMTNEKNTGLKNEIIRIFEEFDLIPSLLTALVLLFIFSLYIIFFVNLIYIFYRNLQ